MKNLNIQAQRSILSAAVYSFNALADQVIVTGTSLRLSTLKKELLSGYGKRTEMGFNQDERSWILKNFDNFEDFRVFLSKYFAIDNLSDADVTFAHSYLQGRARFTAAFVNSLLNWQKCTRMELTSEIFRLKLEETVGNMVLPGKGKNLYQAIDDFTERCRTENHLVMSSILQNIIISYYLHKNLSQYVASDQFEKWIECGIGRIKSSSDGDVVYVNEPLVFIAGYHHFDPLESLLQSINSMTKYSTQGFGFEAISCELLKRNWFRNGQTLNSLFGLFGNPDDKKALSELPSWINNCKVMLYPSNFLVSLQQHTGGGINVFLERVFSGSNTSAFFVPVDSEKIDRFAVLKLDDKFVSVCLQVSDIEFLFS